MIMEAEMPQGVQVSKLETQMSQWSASSRSWMPENQERWWCKFSSASQQSWDSERTDVLVWPWRSVKTNGSAQAVSYSAFLFYVGIQTDWMTPTHITGAICYSQFTSSNVILIQKHLTDTSKIIWIIFS